MVGQERVDPMATTVGQSFAMIEQSFIALADAMPAASYGFKPTDGAFKDVRTFGEQVKHVACGNFALFNEIEKKEPPAACDTGGLHTATTKTELMAYLRESFAYAGRVLRTMTPANALDPTGGPYGSNPTPIVCASAICLSEPYFAVPSAPDAASPNSLLYFAVSDGTHSCSGISRCGDCSLIRSRSNAVHGRA